MSAAHNNDFSCLGMTRFKTFTRTHHLFGLAYNGDEIFMVNLIGGAGNDNLALTFDATNFYPFRQIKLDEVKTEIAGLEKQTKALEGQVQAVNKKNQVLNTCQKERQNQGNRG